MGKLKDITGQKFGKLTVIKFSHINKSSYWLCKCDCGKEKVIWINSLKQGSTRSCGCLNLKTPQRSKGEKSPFWLGDEVQYGALHTRMYKKVKNKGTCKFCKKKCNTDLANISQKYKKTIDDWMWLCKKCHRRYDTGWELKNKKWYKTCIPCGKFIEVNKDNFYQRTNGFWVAHCKECSKRIGKQLKIHNRNRRHKKYLTEKEWHYMYSLLARMIKKDKMW